MKKKSIVAALMTLSLMAGIFGGCSGKGEAEVTDTSETILSAASEMVRETESTYPRIELQPVSTDGEPEKFSVTKENSFYERCLASGYCNSLYEYTEFVPEAVAQRIADDRAYFCSGFDCRFFVYCEELKWAEEEGNGEISYSSPIEGVSPDPKILITDKEGKTVDEFSFMDFWNENFPDVPYNNWLVSDGFRDWNNDFWDIDSGFLMGQLLHYCYFDFRDCKGYPIVLEHDLMSMYATSDFLMALTYEVEDKYIEFFPFDGEKKVVNISDIFPDYNSWSSYHWETYIDGDEVSFEIEDYCGNAANRIFVNINDLSVRIVEWPSDDYDTRYLKRTTDGLFSMNCGLYKTEDGETSVPVFYFVDVVDKNGEPFDDRLQGQVTYIGQDDSGYHFFDGYRAYTISKIDTDKKMIKILLPLDGDDPGVGLYRMYAPDFFTAFNRMSDEYVCVPIRMDFDSDTADEELLAALRSDDPPDLVITRTHMSYLDDSGYLKDLGSFVDENMSDDLYYLQVVNRHVSYKDGGLYTLPLGFVVDIIDNAKGVEFGGTYDAYMEHIKENRYDDIWSEVHWFGGRSHPEYLNIIYANQADLCFSNGKYDFKCQAFYTMLDFVKNNYYQRYSVANEQRYGMPEVMTELYTFLSEKEAKSTTAHGDFMGDGEYSPGDPLNWIPSDDNRGAGIRMNIGISMVEGFGNKEGAEEFLKYAISLEGLKKCEYYNMPIRKDYRVKYGQINWEKYNHDIDATIDDYAYLDEVFNGLFVEPGKDPQIEQIIAEESAAYFDDIYDEITPEQIAERINIRVGALIENRQKAD